MKLDIHQVNETLYYIDDEHGDSMYLVIGDKKALLVDTGMGSDLLLESLKVITTLPIEVVLTHAHIDHMYHVNQFEKVYIHKKEKDAWRWKLSLCVFAGSLMYKVNHKKYPINQMIAVDEGHVFDLGNTKMKVINAFGHTPGSIVLVDEKNQSIYTGDAIGSGLFAWMWLPGSLNVSDYQKSLIHMKEKLLPYNNYTFYGGHHRQSYQEGASCLSLQTIDDMIVLCDLVLHHKIEPCRKEKMFGINLYTYRYQKASFVIRKGNIQ